MGTWVQQGNLFTKLSQKAGLFTFLSRDSKGLRTKTEKYFTFCQGLAFFHTLTTLNSPEIERPFKNNVGKVENAGNQQFLPFPQCFIPVTKQILI